MKVETRSGEIEIGVMSVPGRKGKALYKTRGANIDLLAYFRNDDCAEEFEKALDWIIEEFERR